MVRRFVTFSSDAFNTSEPKDYFINPNCFGDDVARWLMRELNDRGTRTVDQPGQEDFGWYFTFWVGSKAYDFVVGYRPGEGSGEDAWIGWVERKAGLVASILGARRRGIEPAALEAVHDAMSNSPEIGGIRWHYEGDFEASREDRGTVTPLAD
jgi:hypothetical protein